MAGMRVHLLLLCVLLAGPCLADKYKVAAKLPTGIGPGDLALAPDGQRLVVLNSDSGDLSVIRADTLAVAPTIPVARVPMAVAFDSRGQALVASFQDDKVYRVDLEKGEVTGQVAVGDGPRDLQLSGGRLLVPGYYDGSLTVIDPATLTKVKTIELGVGVQQVLPVPGSQRALVVNTSSDRVHIVDPGAEAPAGELDEKLGWGLWHATLTPDGKRALVTGWGSNTLAVLDTNPAMSYALVPLSGKGACQMAVSPDGRFAFVAHSESDTLVKVDLEALKEVASVPTGRFPFSYVAITPDGRDVIVTNDKDGTVSIVDAASMKVSQVLAVGSIPRQILCAQGRIFVTCAFSNHVAVLERE